MAAMNSNKAFAGAGVTFISAILKYIAPDIPNELLAMGTALATGFAIHYVPNREKKVKA